MAFHQYTADSSAIFSFFCGGDSEKKQGMKQSKQTEILARTLNSSASDDGFGAVYGDEVWDKSQLMKFSNFTF